MLWPVLVASLLQGPAGIAGSPPPPLVYAGTEHDLRVSIPRIDASVEVDGRLSEPVWQQAARLTGFSEYAPDDGRAAEDSTEVLVWYSPSAIYFGIRAHAPAGSVHATLANRDNIGTDDYVQLFSARSTTAARPWSSA